MSENHDRQTRGLGNELDLLQVDSTSFLASEQAYNEVARGPPSSRAILNRKKDFLKSKKEPFLS